jgi:hypothetical protein
LDFLQEEWRMWNLFGNSKHGYGEGRGRNKQYEYGGHECGAFRAALEESARGVGGGRADLSALLQRMGSRAGAHAACCGECRQAASELLGVRAALAPLMAAPREVSPYFAKRVMAAIAEKERDLQAAGSVWTMVPRLAAQLSWISTLALIMAGAWFYSARSTAPDNAQNTLTSAEATYLFEAPAPPPNRDDVLVNLAEKDK